SAGAKVLVDDVGWFDDPLYQDGPIGVSIDNAVAAGATYLSAAGNENIILGGKEVGSYESLAWRSASWPSGPPFTNLDCYNFTPAGGSDRTYRVTVAASKTLSVVLQWAQPWGGVTTDLDLCFIPTGGSTVCSAADNIHGFQKPFEFKEITNNSATANTV